MRFMNLLLAAWLMILAGGCGSIGPGTVARDRFDYSSSIGESWKRQTLLNVVKLRYLDPPIFVDVGQIVAGYSLETGINLGGSFPATSALGGDTATLGGSGKYTDRPTVTYTPLTGNKFIKSLMMPLAPEAVFFTIQSGWPADAVLSSAVAGINGLKNQELSLTGVTPADADFQRVLELMRRLQASGVVGLRIQQDAQKQQTTLLTISAPGVAEQTMADSRELRRLLRVDPNATEFKLVFGSTAVSDREIAVLTRSLTHIMAMLSAHVEVPAEHVAQGRAAPGAKSGAVRIRCTPRAPREAFVAVPYRDHWFWIDDRDLQAKRAFSFLMILFTLADTGERDPLPLITIPAQ
jgi:hypothetical protein